MKCGRPGVVPRRTDTDAASEETDRFGAKMYVIAQPRSFGRMRDSPGIGLSPHPRAGSRGGGILVPILLYGCSQPWRWGRPCVKQANLKHKDWSNL